jgi:hypothetical protein
MSDYLISFTEINGYFAYKNFVSTELTKLTDKLTIQIQDAENLLQTEQKEVIKEIKITQQQIYHIFSHLKYLCAQVRKLQPSIFNQVNRLVNIIRQDRRTHQTPQALVVLLAQVNINLIQLSVIEQTELALLVHLAYNERRIVQTRAQFYLLNERLIKLNQVASERVNKKQKIN